MKLKLDEVYESATWRAAGAEYLATLLFVFLGAGAVVTSGIVMGGQLDAARLVAIAVAHGLAIMLLVSATAPISGGHINPAVSFAAWVTGKIGSGKLALYVLAQVAGGVSGAFLLKAVIPNALEGGLGSHGLGNMVGSGAGLLAEVVLTFTLVFVVFATAIDKKGLTHLAPLAIGFAVLVDHLVGVPLTGASMNPARTFGPAWASGNWDHHWIFWVGPLLGGALAALAYEKLFASKD